MLALLCATALSGSFTSSALAQSPPGAARTAAFDIPPQPLSQALVRFSKLAGLQLFFDASLARGISSPGVQGTFSQSEALGRLLAGSGLIYRFNNVNTVTVQRPGATAGGAGPAGSINLETIDVQGQGNSATTEGSNSYSSGRATVTKDGASLKETPQSVSVITRKRLDDQNLVTLDKALTNATGIVVQQGDADRAAYYARGFPISTIQVDGVPTNIALPTAAQDLAMYDRVEVLRGPAGLLSGLGSPGGTINLVRKLPMSDFHATEEFSFGSYGYLRNMIDVTGPLNDSKTVRGRVVGTLQSQDFVENSTYRHLGQIYGILEGDVSDSTTVRVGGFYQDSPARQGWVGVPVTTNYQFVNAPRSTFFGAPWNKDIYSQTGAFGEIEHKFDNGWATKATINYLRYQSDVTAFSINSQVDPTTMTADGVSNRWTQDDQQTALDWYASGPVSLFGRTHKVTFGVNASHEDLGQKNFYGPLDPFNAFYSTSVNIFDLNVPKPAFDGGVYGRHTLTNQYAFYGDARISLADPLTLVLGGRVLWWDSAYRVNPNENYWGDPNTKDRIDAKPIPFAGLIYDINSTYVLYASYAQIFQPQTTRNAAHELLKPVQGEQYETGIKASYLDGRVIATLAFFSLTQQNRALADPTDPTGQTYFAQGKARSQGVEAEISGRLTNQWNVFAGYTFTETKNYDTSSSTDFIAFTAIAPKHLFKVWSTYNLPDQFSKWTVGGGVYASSKFYNEDTGGQLVANGFATVSASLAYKFSDSVTATLNVDNIFDKKYIRSLNGTASGFYGDPRTASLKVRATW